MRCKIKNNKDIVELIVDVKNQSPDFGIFIYNLKMLLGSGLRVVVVTDLIDILYRDRPYPGRC
jgi:hypothetical protein